MRQLADRPAMHFVLPRYAKCRVDEANPTYIAT